MVVALCRRPASDPERRCRFSNCVQSMTEFCVLWTFHSRSDPPIHPSGLSMVLTQSTSSARCGRSAKHPYSAIVLCVQMPLVRPLRCVMGLDFGSNTMMYLSHDPCVWSQVSPHEGRDGCLYISPWSWSKILRSHLVHSNRFLHQERGTTLLNHGHSESRRFQPVHSRRPPR